MSQHTIGATLIALVLVPHLMFAQETRPAQDAAQPNTLFPQWRLQSVHAIDPRVAPNAGLGLHRSSQLSRQLLLTFSGPAVHPRPGLCAGRWRCSAWTMSAPPRNSRSFAICGPA